MNWRKDLILLLASNETERKEFIEATINEYLLDGDDKALVAAMDIYREAMCHVK